MSMSFRSTKTLALAFEDLVGKVLGERTDSPWVKSKGKREEHGWRGRRTTHAEKEAAKKSFPLRSFHLDR
jgi:hypothetical protein